MVETLAAKRRFPRVSSENALLVKKLTPDGDEGFAKTRVVGLGGCMFVSDELLGTGSEIELLISVHGKVAKLTGRVVYEIEKAPQYVEVGVEFVDLEAPDRKVIEGLFPAGPTPT